MDPKIGVIAHASPLVDLPFWPGPKLNKNLQMTKDFTRQVKTVNVLKSSF